MKYIIIFFVCLSIVSARKHANCTIKEISGYWLFDESEAIDDENINCPQKSQVPKPTHQIKIKLEEPNIAIDVFGNKGTWTSIYGFAIEVTVNYRKYFAFMYAISRASNLTSKCNETVTGFSHNVLNYNWACFKGKKIASFDDLTFISREKTHFVELKVGKFPEHQLFWKPLIAPSSEETKLLVSKLPGTFDWRNVNGFNYVPPVTQQGSCGDCYAHASVGMLSSRVRIATNNTQKSVLSIQQIVDCTKLKHYSNGCGGGLIYTAAGIF